MRTKTSRSTIIVYRCPDCGHEVEQQLFGTSHTSSIACVQCERAMRTIPLADSAYDYSDELIENDGEYTQEFEVPETEDQLKKFIESQKEDL